MAKSDLQDAFDEKITTSYEQSLKPEQKKLHQRILLELAIAVGDGAGKMRWTEAAIQYCRDLYGESVAKAILDGHAWKGDKRRAALSVAKAFGKWAVKYAKDRDDKEVSSNAAIQARNRIRSKYYHRCTYKNKDGQVIKGVWCEA